VRRERRPPERQRRLVAAIAASTATGATIYLVVMGLLVPALEARVTSSDVAWLRHAFMHRPGAVLAVLALVSAVLALPVLAVFRVVSGPWSDR
jgi:predicted PurR-regulated permease PerM